jgi:thermitase
MRKKGIKFLCCAGFVLFLFVETAFSLYFRLDGDRLWLQAEQTPLVEILNQFSRTGVEVHLDPRIHSTVTGSVRGAELDDALESLLESYDYLLTWKMLRGPLGRVPKLHSIEIFKPGGESSTERLPVRKTRFEATRGISGTGSEFVKDELLVAVRPGTTYAQFKQLLDEIGGMLVEADAATGIYLIRFPAGTNVEALLQQVSRNSLIAHAELNDISRLPSDTTSSSTVKFADLPHVNPPADGSIPVAVLDSGLAPDSNLSPLITAGWDAVNPDQVLSDSAGHGTQMAYLASGLLAANGMSASEELLPVVAVRAFDEEGKTSNFAIIQALAYAKQAGAKVVNMSWGSETDSDFMRTAMKVAAQQGMILVAAAGNEPTGRPVYPAAYPTVLGVGGSTADGQPWDQSNTGPFVALSAPATASFPVGHNGPPGAYAGTSISSAAAANALAQYCNQNPNATAASAWAALQQALSPPLAEGYGIGQLDKAALQRFLSP